MAVTAERPRGTIESTKVADTDADLLWIRPSSGWHVVDLASIWAHRELLFYFAWRDVKVRYKQTAFGITWVLIQPVIQAAIFSVIFGLIAGLPSEGVPYAIFAFSGLVPWFYFSSTVSKMSTSLDGNLQLITKVYFPRIILPISVMFGTLVDFLVALPVLVALALYFGVPFASNWLAMPAVVLLLMAVSLGAGLWLAALNARYRDISIGLPFILQVGFYVTPVVFPASVIAAVIPADYFPVLWAFNPMLGVVEAFRWAALGSAIFPLGQVLLASVTTLLLVLTGGLYFARTERTLVDRI